MEGRRTGKKRFLFRNNLKNLKLLDKMALDFGVVSEGLPGLIKNMVNRTLKHLLV